MAGFSFWDLQSGFWDVMHNARHEGRTWQSRGWVTSTRESVCSGGSSTEEAGQLLALNATP